MDLCFTVLSGLGIQLIALKLPVQTENSKQVTHCKAVLIGIMSSVCHQASLVQFVVAALTNLSQKERIVLEI